MVVALRLCKAAACNTCSVACPSCKACNTAAERHVLSMLCSLSVVCSAAAALAKKLNIDCPIIDGIFRVIHRNAEPLEVSPSNFDTNQMEQGGGTFDVDAYAALLRLPDHCVVQHWLLLYLLWRA